MTLIARTRYILENWTGAPGYNILHFSGGIPSGQSWSQEVVNSLATELHAILGDLQKHVCAGVSMRLDPEFALIESTTGKIQDVVIATEGLNAWTATGADTAVPRGACMNIKFMGDRYVNGRRLNGRMYLGPLAGDQFDASGQIKASTIPYVEEYFSGLLGGIGARLAVYHRPTTSGVADGSYADVAEVKVQQRPSYLRSRSI